MYGQIHIHVRLVRIPCRQALHSSRLTLALSAVSLETSLETLRIEMAFNMNKINVNILKSPKFFSNVLNEFYSPRRPPHHGHLCHGQLQSTHSAKQSTCGMEF